MCAFTVLVLNLIFIFYFILAFCHVDIDVCIYCTCAFLYFIFIVKWILMLIIQRCNLVNLYGIQRCIRVIINYRKMITLRPPLQKRCTLHTFSFFHNGTQVQQAKPDDKRTKASACKSKSQCAIFPRSSNTRSTDCLTFE